MRYLEEFLENIIDYGRDKYIFFENKKYKYIEVLEKSYSLARLLESLGYKKIYSNLNNSPLSVSLYIASWIANIDIFVAINPRLIDYELSLIIEKNNSLFITDKHSKLNINIFYIKNNLDFFDNIDKKNDFTVHAKALIGHISSGTTSFYQKYFHTIKQIIFYAKHRVYDLGLQENDHLLVALSINHAFAFSYQILPALAMGLNMTIIKEFNPKVVAQIINKKIVTALALLPTMYYLLINEDINCNNNLHYLSVAGDMISTNLALSIQRKLKLPLLNGIGMTEVFGYGQNIISNEINTIKIFSDTRIKIIKYRNNNYGKIFIKNNMLPINNKIKWLETGDIGSFNNNSYELKFYGRYKDIIIKGGSNILPIELENVILKISGINDCFIVPKKDKIWGEIICAFLISSKYYSLNFINSELTKYLANYKKIDKIIYINKIPLTSTGKIDKNRLKEMINNE